MSSWSLEAIQTLLAEPFLGLVHRAYSVHQSHFPDNDMEMCALLNIKTGCCPEDCGYCSQSGHHKTDLEREKLLDVNTVLHEAKRAKAQGAKRFCMGAAWRNPPKKDFPKVIEMIKGVKALGLETCVTLGMLDEEQVAALEVAGLDYYNHNLDTSEAFYPEVCSTRTYQDRLDTLERLAHSQINVCCGGIMGMGESAADRAAFIWQLTQLTETPKSIPINRLVPVKGTPMADLPLIDNFDFIRTIAATRIVFPKARIRLSAGRQSMSEEMQTLCFMAGANSIWVGEKLLTVANTQAGSDNTLLGKLGINQVSNEVKSQETLLTQ